MDRDRYSRLLAKGASLDSYVIFIKFFLRYGVRGRGFEILNY